MNPTGPGRFRWRCDVNGAWIEAEDGATMEVTNPADGARLGTAARRRAGGRRHRRSAGGPHRQEERAARLRFWRVSEAVEYGEADTNTKPVSTEVAPFGGVKESGIGREGSRFGLEEYLEIKYLCMGGIDR